jgi:hypothetical protein
MTARSDDLVKAPLFGTVAILVSGLMLLVATGPAIAAERNTVGVAGSTQTPPADPQGARAS